MSWIHCKVRNWVLNQKLRIRNLTRIRNCRASEAAHQKPPHIRNRCASETAAHQKPAHRKPAHVRNWRCVSETGVWKLARELGSNAGVVRREHAWPNYDNGMVSCVMRRASHDNICGLMHSEHKASRARQNIHGPTMTPWPDAL